MELVDYIPSGSIYKYVPVESALLILNNRSLKFTCPLEFNDPFDCNTALLSFAKTPASLKMLKEAVSRQPSVRAERRDYFKKITTPHGYAAFYKRLANQKINASKVTCFSKNYSNTLMWSHYADQHRGICLAFDGSMLPADILERGEASLLNVDYDSTGMIQFNQGDDETSIREVMELFTRKSADWRYEEEVRLTIMDDCTVHKFNKPFLLGAIIGCRTPPADKQAILEAIKSQGYAVRVQQAIKGTYKLRFKQLS